MNKPRIYVNLKADMTEGARYVDFTAMLEALESGQPVSEVDLAKLEHTAMSGSMPPAKFSHMPNHWGTSLDNDEKAVILSWAANERKACFSSPTVADEFANEPLQPLMESIPVDSAKVALGFALYHDTRLSADNTVSCATCHGLETDHLLNIPILSIAVHLVHGLYKHTVFFISRPKLYIRIGIITKVSSTKKGEPTH